MDIHSMRLRLYPSRAQHSNPSSYSIFVYKNSILLHNFLFSNVIYKMFLYTENNIRNNSFNRPVFTGRPEHERQYSPYFMENMRIIGGGSASALFDTIFDL
jgi:hypothetical protein